MGSFSTDRKLSQQWPNAFSSVSLAGPKLFQQLFHQTQSVCHQFFNSPNMFSVFHRPEAVSSIIQQHQNAFNKLSNGPKLFQLFSKDPKMVSTAFPTAQSVFSSFNKKHSCCNRLFNRAKIVSTAFLQTQSSSNRLFSAIPPAF